MSKPILCLDFDNVIHSCISGRQDPMVVADPPVEGAIEALKAYTERFRVCIHSSRFNWVNNPREGPDYVDWNASTRLKKPVTPTTQDAVKDWLVANDIPDDWICMYGDRLVEDYDVFFPRGGPRIFLVETKPSAVATIDARAIPFDGTFPDMETIAAFVPQDEAAKV